MSKTVRDPVSEPQNKVFTRSLFLSPLLILLIPAFSLWFFDRAEKSLDQEALSALSESLSKSSEVDVERKSEILASFRNHPVSEAMSGGDPRSVEIQEMFSGVKTRFAIFRWAKTVALICLAATFTVVLPLLIALGLARRSQKAFYWSLRAGWQLLRGLAVVQVIGQAVLASLLSYWVTILWTNSYYPKLVVMLSLLALLGVVALICAIFAKLPGKQEIEGTLLTEEEAPALWSRIRHMAGGTGTAAPDRIIAGIDANFFVTQSPVIFEGHPHHGHTLYVSLPLLKTMSVAEADAVLGHEMAHFSGEDTEFSMKIAPLLQRWHQYLLLLEDGITRPVFHFMNVFRCLYLKVLGDHNRSREFRADRLGAKLTSSLAMVRALVKIAAYAHWRATTEHGLLSKNERPENLHLRKKIEAGFPASFQTFVSSSDALDSQTPHPFDSHPPTNKRMAHLGINPSTALKDSTLLAPPSDSWYWAINDAEKREEALWTRHQNQIESLHTQLVALRLMPENAAEEAILVQAYPPLSFTRGKKTATLTYDCLMLSSWSVPVFMNDICGCSIDSAIGGPELTLTVANHTGKKPRVVKLSPKRFRGPDGNLLDAFKKYYGRHLAAVAHRDELATHHHFHGTPAEGTPAAVA